MKLISKKLSAVAVGVALLTAASLTHAVVNRYNGGAHFLKRAVTNTNAQTTSSTTFVALPDANTSFSIGPGQAVMVNASFDAESRCNEPGSAATNWCALRILINGVEGSPAVGTNFAFDSTDGGTEGIGSWESHAMSRHLCVRNTSTTAPLAVNVSVQWAVVNGDGGVAPTFWIDDSSLVVEAAKGCTQTIPFPPL